MMDKLCSTLTTKNMFSLLSAYGSQNRFNHPFEAQNERMQVLHFGTMSSTIYHKLKLNHCHDIHDVQILHKVQNDYYVAIFPCGS
jgi:hypothetical protein